MGSSLQDSELSFTDSSPRNRHPLKKLTIVNKSFEILLDKATSESFTGWGDDTDD